MAAEDRNKSSVEALYKALACGDTETVAALLATDLEWWFHGPPSCQHMMRILTGETTFKDYFRFHPQRITAIGDWAVAEGWEGEKSYWVHVWTLKEGVITQFREYFNTSLIVREFNPPDWAAPTNPRLSPTLWQSGSWEREVNLSLPGLVLAI